MDRDKTLNRTSGRETSPEAYGELTGGTEAGRRNLSVALIICGAGLWCLARAFSGGDLEWRLVAMIALAVALTPMRAVLRGPHPHAIEFSLSHPVLFACALALGPFGAALPAVFSGIARLVAAGPSHRPLHTVLYTLLKPAAVCCASAAVYAALGGSVICPQAVDSLVPVLVSGLVYALAGASLVGLVEEPDRRADAERPSAPRTIAGWGMCLLAGYAAAVLYATAPAYVLLACAAATGLLRTALREPGREQAEDRELEQGGRGSCRAQSPDSAGASISSMASSDSAGASPSLPDVDDDSAFVDSATGLANRRYVEMFLNREISRADRLTRPLAVAVFDLDDSRKLAETSGPEALEGALREIGARLKSELRDYDVIARYSAGRLIVALPESSMEHALEVVERLHASFASVRMGNKPVSVSVGLAAFPEDAADADGLINSAHRALNSGRFAGPGRVSTCEELDKAS
jgi:diguanylate cyclase (GGDEF)-like protein